MADYIQSFILSQHNWTVAPILISAVCVLILSVAFIFFLGLYAVTNQQHTNQAYQAYITSQAYQADKDRCAFLNNHGMWQQFVNECDVNSTHVGNRTLTAHGFPNG
jgi:hypothetical protein